MSTPRNLWPYGIITAFVLFASGIASVIIIAVTHRESLVNENYYEQEIQFQNHIDGAARAQRAGAAVDFNTATGRVTVSLPAAQVGSTLSGHIELYRPSAAGLDRQIQLQPDARGVQSLDVAGLTAGLWVVRVAWNAGGQDYFLDRKIVIAAK